MSPAKKFFSGNTLEQAVLQAARHFQVAPEEVAYEQVDRRHGFLKVRRRVVIGVDPEAPRRDATHVSAPETEPEVERDGVGESPSVDHNDQVNDEETPPEVELEQEEEPTEVAPRSGPGHEDAWKSLSPADAVEAAEEALRRVFRLGGLDLSAQVTTTDAGLEVELGGSDEDQLFEDRGRLLLAFQHLLPRMIRGLAGVSVPCRVDSDNFHEVRAEQLRMLAHDAADEVRRERRMQSLEPMSPDERRIIHLTLADDPAVETESHGTGLFKRVAIRPVGRQSQGRDRYNR
jgi:spoIIIJ-associated protein